MSSTTLALEACAQTVTDGGLSGTDRELVVFKIQPDCDMDFLNLFRVQANVRIGALSCMHCADPIFQNIYKGLTFAISTAQAVLALGEAGSGIKMIVFSPRTVAFIYVQASSPADMNVLFPEAPASKIVRCPPFRCALDELVLYRASPGSWVHIRVWDTCGDWRMVIGVVSSVSPEGIVKVYIVPLVHGKYIEADEKTLRKCFNNSDSSIVTKGEDIYVLQGSRFQFRHFRYGLEVVEVHVKNLLPPLRPTETAVRRLRNKLLPSELELWMKARETLKQYDMSAALPGAKCKIVAGGLAGCVATVIDDKPGKMMGDIPVIIGGVKHQRRVYGNIAIMRFDFAIGDEVIAKTESGEDVVGFVCSKLESGVFIIFQHATVSSSTVFPVRMLTQGSSLCTTTSREIHLNTLIAWSSA